MKRETLRVVWKFIRRKEYGRIPKTYCDYIIENKNHKHRLKTKEGTKLFELLDNTVIYKKSGTNHEVFVDVIYDNNDNLLYITNFRKINITHFHNFDTKNITKKYKRNCPTCNKEIYYKYNYNKNAANRKKSMCRSCINKKRKLNI